MKTGKLNLRIALGFTLVELMIVLVIIAILATLAISAIGKANCAGDVTELKGAINECRTLLSTVNTAAKAQDLMHCAWKGMDLAKKMKEKDWWEDNKKSIKELWDKFKIQYDALRATNPEWGMAELPADPSDGPPDGFPAPPQSP